MSRSKFFPFKYKLVILLFTIVFFVASTLAAFQFVILRNSLEDDFQQKRKLIHDRVLNMIKNADYVNLLNERPIEAAAEEILNRIENSYKVHNNIDFDLQAFLPGNNNFQLYIIDKKNTIIKATDTIDIGLDFHKYPNFVKYLEEIRASGKFSSSRVSLSIKKGDLMKYCYLPSYDGKYLFETGSKIEAYEAYAYNVDFEDFEHQLLEENNFVDSVLLYDYQGVSYKKDGKGNNIKISSANAGYFNEALQTMKTIKISGMYDGEKAYYEYIPYEIMGARGANERNVIEIIYNDRDVREKLNYNIGLIVIVVILSASVSAAIGYYMASKLTKPVEELTECARQVASGNLNYKFQLKINDEMSILGSQFNQMTKELSDFLEERYLFEKNLQLKNQEIFNQKEEISALYEETIALNEELEHMLYQNWESYFETVRVLANAIEEKDSYTGVHCERVMEYSMGIAKEVGLGQNELNDLKFGSVLHDIGKIGIAENILNKEGKLTEAEYEEIKKHPVKGNNILKNLNFLTNCCRIIYEHHERVDGKGYPNGLHDDQIYFLAKIVCVADAYDAMTSSRPYRKNHLTQEEAINELQKNRGTQFDSTVVDAFINYLINKQNT